jgi:hypothetical protein
MIWTGLLLRQITSCEIARIIVILLQHCTMIWPYSCMPVESCCVITKSSGRSAWTRVAKWKVIITDVDGLRGSGEKKALHRQVLTVGCLQFVERKHLQAALCSAGHGSSTGTRKLHRRLSVSGVASRHPKELLREAIRKLPMRWQRCITYERNVLS